MITNGKRLLNTLSMSLALTYGAKVRATLSATQGKLHIEVHHEGSTLRASLAAEGEIETCSVDARRVRDFIRTALSAHRRTEIILCTSRAGRLEISCGSSTGDFARESATSSDAPVVAPEVGACEVSLDVFCARLRWVRSAASSDPTRTMLHGVQFDAENAAVAATDGHRLHVATVPGLAGASFTAPLNIIDALLAIPSDKGDLVTIEGNEQLIRFVAPSFTLTATPNADPFPPFRQVIPNRHDQTFAFVARSSVMRSAIQQVVVRHGSPAPCTLAMNGAVLLRGSTKEDGSQSTIGIDILETTHVGDMTIIGVDGRYLRDAMSGKGAPKVEVSFGGGLDPILVRYVDDSMQAVVMPMRI